MLRQSVLGRYGPDLRHRVPRLYALGRAVWDWLIPLRSQHNLARYQARAVHHLEHFLGPALNTSEILEIGSDADGRVARELRARGARRVVGINRSFEGSTWPGSSNEVSMIQADARALPFPADTFGAVFSVSVFEHLNDFGQCLSEMYRVLKPGGHVYAAFGPIWSSSVGHHVHAVADGQEVRHWKPETNPVPNYGHLLARQDELRLGLEERGVAPQLALAIVDWIYMSPAINRLFFEDYLRLLEESAFEVLRLDTDVEHVAPALQRDLQRSCPGYLRFDVRNAELCMRRRR